MAWLEANFTEIKQEMLLVEKIGMSRDLNLRHRRARHQKREEGAVIRLKVARLSRWQTSEANLAGRLGGTMVRSEAAYECSSGFLSNRARR